MKTDYGQDPANEKKEREDNLIMRLQMRCTQNNRNKSSDSWYNSSTETCSDLSQKQLAGQQNNFTVGQKLDLGSELDGN